MCLDYILGISSTMFFIAANNKKRKKEDKRRDWENELVIPMHLVFKKVTVRLVVLAVVTLLSGMVLHNFTTWAPLFPSPSPASRNLTDQN